MITVDDFQLYDGAPIDPGSIRMRCICRAEYSIVQSRNCPACGRRVPKAVSINGGRWKSYIEWKADSLRGMLAPDKQEKIPPEHRDAVRQNLEKQIRQLEDGTWKRETQRRIELLQDMLDKKSETPYAAVFNGFSEEQHQEMSKAWELAIRTAQQELEVAGETA